MERGGALIHKHFQMVVKGNFTSLPVLNKKIKVCLGWYASPSMVHVGSCKKMRDEGLHTLKGMIGYHMKDNGGIREVWKDGFEQSNESLS